MQTLKLTQIGNSVGVILPKDLLAGLVVTKGDTIDAIEQPNGVRPMTPEGDFGALFIRRNGRRLNAADADAVLRTIAMAAGEPTDDELTDWVREYTTVPP